MEIDIRGYKVLIDESDREKIKRFNWVSRRLNGYVYFIAHSHYEGSRQVSLNLHRYLAGCSYGDGKIVDHINGNTLDNRKCNLRACSKRENNCNSKISIANTSGYKGVCWNKWHGKWQAQINNNGHKNHLGYFNCPTSAWFAYVRAAQRLHGEYANFG